MTRTSMPSAPRSLTLNIGTLHRFIIAFYAHQKGVSHTEVYRMLAESVVRSERAQGRFDERAFRKFVDLDTGTPPEDREHLRDEIERFLKALQAGDAGSKTGSKSKA